MTALKFAPILLASVGLTVLGCSDKEQSPVAPTDQSAQTPVSLKKCIVTNFTLSHNPTGLTGEGEVKLVPGGKWLIKKYGVVEQVVASDPLVSGTMVHYLSATFDAATGEGPCYGSFTLTPDRSVAGGGVWKGNYAGWRSRTSVDGVFTLPLKVVGRGKGGTIDGMPLLEETLITAYGTPPTYWTGKGKGLYTSY